MMSGDVVWCNICGAYGTHRGRGMAKPCAGSVRMGTGGGRWQQLQLLRAGKHPKDLYFLGEPVPEAQWVVQTAATPHRIFFQPP